MIQIKQRQLTGRPVYIVDGARTPFLKVKGKPGPFSSADMGTWACRELLARQPFAASEIQEVVTGCAVASVDETNISRIIALRSGCAENTPAWTVQRNCASGMQALDSGIKDIAMNRCDLVLAGGTDSMSHGPLLYNNAMVNWFAQLARSKNFTAKLKTFLAFRPHMLAPVIGLLRGLTDPVCGLSMGATAEIVAYDFGVTREMMDAFSVQSHQRLVKAQTEKLLSEIITIYDTKGNVYTADDGVRADSTVEKLATLKPAYDKPFGTVTAANSSQVTDGAAFVILASEEALKQYQLKPLAKIVDVNWGALNPAVMGLGPVHATAPLLARNNLKISDIDYFEINEAFAAQVLGCIAAFESADYCKTHFGLDESMGTLDQARLNIDGGAIALGHPIGATGARLALHMTHILQRKNARFGVATLCIGGGQGGAMLIEKV